MAPPEALHPLLPHQLHGCGPRLPDASYRLRGALQGPALLCQVQRALASSRSTLPRACQGARWSVLILILIR